ncbi:hypothetical protein [Rhizobium sp. SG570]|uniref:hypothetical protein n=1 Tax=Rhizobium sp. SG570 TaxID=2587113 RepID=UPI0014471C01|nr:hypothetical protein [Rhizobium sp. SG570]NKJ33697.1 hypothetical protein [Rhizobium sp. SG570]
MNDSRALKYAPPIDEPDEGADFLSLNFILEMHSFLDNHSKMKGNPSAGLCNRIVPSTLNSEGKFLVSSAAA